MSGKSPPTVKKCKKQLIFVRKIANKLQIMAKLSYYLDTRRPDRNGEYPLTISVAHNGKTLRIATGKRFTVAEWEAVRAKISSGRKAEWDSMTEEIYFGKARYEAALDLVSKTEDIEVMDVKDLRSRLEKQVNGESREARRERTRGGTRKGEFLGHYTRFMESRDTPGTREVYLRTRKKIEEFDPDAARLGFDDITRDWLTRFDTFLQATTSANIRNMHFRNIKAVFNDAIDNDLTAAYPFRKFRLPKLEETRKRALSLRQLRMLASYRCEPWQEEYWDMFMLMVYLIGINAVDLLSAKAGDIVDGRLEYRRAKTHKLYSVKVEPEAMAIIDKYRGKDWLLSPLDRYASHKDYIQHMNKALKTIGMTYPPGKSPEGDPLFPGLSTYWARHSWATAAANIDIPLDVIGRAMGHSWVTKTVTSVYIDFDRRKVDEANRRVIDAIGER